MEEDDESHFNAAGLTCRTGFKETFLGASNELLESKYFKQVQVEVKGFSTTFANHMLLKQPVL